MTKPIMIAAALCLLFKCACAQNIAADSVKATVAENNAAQYFNTNIKQQSRLYNGPEYVDYPGNIKGNAYFEDLKDFVPGTVTFDGYTYPNVPLKYDLFKDLLVTQLYAKTSQFTLFSAKVSSFDMHGHHFKYITADTVKNLPAAGFYEQLYGGKTQALARYSKTRQNEASAVVAQYYFTGTKQSFFVAARNQVIEVGSINNVIKALGTHKKELQQYVKDQHIEYKKQPGQAIAAIVAYYDSLTK